MLFNIAVNPQELIVEGVGYSFNIGDIMRASCEVRRILPVPLAMYWQYNGTRIHRGYVSSRMKMDMKDYKIISFLHLTITAKDEGCSLTCLVEMEDGKQLESKQNIILTNKFGSK